jgi:acyl-CoA thioesterase FadM
MLQVWTLHDRRQQPPTPGSDNPEAELFEKLRLNGFVASLGTNCEQDYIRPLKLGDRVTSQGTILSVVGPKSTSLGDGYFITTETSHTTADGELIGKMRLRVLKYRPSGQPPKVVGPRRPAAITSDPTAVIGRSQGVRTTMTRGFDTVAIGDRLPQLTVPITTTLIVCGAIATSDFYVLHHDRDRAQAAGMPDIFMNLLTTTGLVGRFISEWVGPEASVNQMSLRFGAPNYPYDTLLIDGEVTEAKDGRIQIGVRGANSLGDHVTGHAKVALR